MSNPFDKLPDGVFAINLDDFLGLIAGEAPGYNGVPGDSCECPFCNQRRAEFGPDTSKDGRDMTEAVTGLKAENASQKPRNPQKGPNWDRYQDRINDLEKQLSTIRQVQELDASEDPRDQLKLIMLLVELLK